MGTRPSVVFVKKGFGEPKPEPSDHIFWIQSQARFVRVRDQVYDVVLRGLLSGVLLTVPLDNVLDDHVKSIATSWVPST